MKAASNTNNNLLKAVKENQSLHFRVIDSYTQAIIMDYRADSNFARDMFSQKLEKFAQEYSITQFYIESEEMTDHREFHSKVKLISLPR